MYGEFRVERGVSPQISVVEADLCRWPATFQLAGNSAHQMGLFA